ncbi:MAG: PQQ-binding-like beta-propeller repeat protein, partial [Spirochaetia bacterium]|nr:PQQ-binding-like beta-propeller repeat protein [Spirochaetia bacterium]
MKSFRLEISKTRIFAFILITAYLPFIYPADIDSREFLSLKSVFATGGRISGDPLAAPGGGILFFSEDRYLYSFDSSGAFLSRKKIKNSFSPFHAQGIDRIIYKYFRDNSLKAVNSSGQILWSVKINSTLLYAPFISSSGDIITAEDDGILSSYSYSGRKRWELDLKNSPVTNSSKAAMSCIPCAGLSGVIYAGMSDGNIVSLNSSGKIIKWIKNTENSITALFSSGRKLYASDTKGRLLVYNKDLDLQKSLKLKSPVLSIRASRNLLAVIHRNGSASVYDDEMKLLRSFGSSMKITGEQLLDDRNVYFLAGKGFVAWFDSLSGISGEASIPLKAVNGIREVKDKYPHHSFLYKEGAILAAGGEDWN